MHLRELASRSFGAAASFGARRAGLVSLVALILAGIGFWRAGFLRIDSDFRALIPADFPSVQNIDDLERRVGSLTELVVEVRSPDREANIRYGTALAAELQKLDERFRWVEVRRDIDWFEDRALLFLSLRELLDLRDRVVRRIRREVTREVVQDVDAAPKDGATDGATDGAGPKTAATAEDDPLDLDDDEVQEKYGGSVPGEYLEASSESEHLLVVHGLPRRGTTDMDFTIALVADVDAAIAKVDPGSYHPAMKAAIRGGYHDFQVEMSSVKEDIVDSGLVALLLLLLVLIVQYKRLRVLPMLMVPLILSVLLTVAVATWMYDALNLIAGFIFVVLLGLGIDFGIHLLSRYEFERLRGVGQREAIDRAARTTGVDVATGAATSVVVFLLFTIAEFRGYSQFGALAAIGVTLAFLCMLLLMPALLVLYERIRPWKPRRWLPMVDADRADDPGRHRGLAGLVVAASVGAAIASLATAERVPFEYDLSKLGKNLDAVEDRDALHWSDAIGHPDVGPALALGRTTEDARHIDRQLRGLTEITDAQMEQLLDGPLPEDERRVSDPEPVGTAPELDGVDPDDIDEDDPFAASDPFADLRAELSGGALTSAAKELVATYPMARIRLMRRFLDKHLSIWSFVPERQEEKLALIRDIRRRLDAKWDALSPETQKRAERLREYSAIDTAITFDELPEWLKARWREADGTVGRNVILWNSGNKADGHTIALLREAFGELATKPGAGPGVPLAATYLVLPDILDAVVRDGPRILLAALLGVLVWLLAMFRSVRLVVLILVPLATAIAWLAGLFLFFDWKINIYNIVTFAVLIGIGVDHGVHMVGRWVEDGGRSVRLAIRETGVAIASTSVTTAIGFGGLMVGGHRGLASLGETAAAGILLVLVAAMTTLPALLHLFGRRAERRQAQRSESAS